MKAYIWGDNSAATIAANKEEAIKNARARFDNHPQLLELLDKEPIEVPENYTRILYTNWPGA